MVPAELAGDQGRNRGLLRGICVLALLLAAFIVLCADRAGSGDHRLRLSIDAPRGGALQVYYQTEGGLSEEQSVRSALVAGSNQLVFTLPNEAITGLRFDPEPGTRQLVLRQLAIQDPGSAQARPLPLSTLQGMAEIQALDIRADGVAITTLEGAKDAQAWLVVQEGHASEGTLAAAVRWAQRLLMLLGLFAFVRLVTSRETLPVSPMLATALVLSAALAFASVTGHSVHPDEFNHVSAAGYYATHWLPPAVDDPAIVGTYSIYGTSYLNELDIVYLIAAKVAKLWSGLGLNEVVALRLFNVALFAILVVLATWRRPAAWSLGVLLITPQVWYVFAYFNADAFPFFLAVVLALMAGPADGRLSGFIAGEKRGWWAPLLFVVLLALLLVSKRNYLTIVFAFAMLLALRHLQLRGWTTALGMIGAALLLLFAVTGPSVDLILPAGLSGQIVAPLALLLLLVPAVDALHAFLRKPTVRAPALRLGALFALAVVLAAPRIALDVRANGGSEQKAQKMRVVAERYADMRFKPSTLENNPQGSYAGLRLAAKGATLGQVLGEPYGWVTQSWRSLLGVYGYMNVFAPAAIYALLSLGGGVLLLSVFIASWADPGSRRYLWTAVGGMALVALSSLFHSWANDFQPQGRYLLPALAILVAYLAAYPAVLRTRLAGTGIALAYAGGLFSLIVVALPALTR